MVTSRKIRILIVDDHDMVRHGLIVLLQAFDDFEVVGQTGDGCMALTLSTAYRPDVVLMDLFMPRMDGITSINLILNTFPKIAIIVLTSSADETLVNAALKAGAISYLLKTGTIDDIADAVRAAYTGKSILSSEAVQALISDSSLAASPIGHDLTRRQREVLALMVDGLNNRRIAEHLCISLSTVKNHIVGIFSKFNTSNRTKVVALAVQNKLVAKH